jgi:hypothetical protein
MVVNPADGYYDKPSGSIDHCRGYEKATPPKTVSFSPPLRGSLRVLLPLLRLANLLKHHSLYPNKAFIFLKSG